MQHDDVGHLDRLELPPDLLPELRLLGDRQLVGAPVRPARVPDYRTLPGKQFHDPCLPVLGLLHAHGAAQINHSPSVCVREGLLSGVHASDGRAVYQIALGATIPEAGPLTIASASRGSSRLLPIAANQRPMSTSWFVGNAPTMLSRKSFSATCCPRLL